MRVEIRTLHVRVSGRLREHIQRRAHARLSRFGDHIRRVAIRLSDLNGPRRGQDRVCQVITTLPGVAPLVVEDRDARLTLAADHALRRTARHVDRQLKRQAATWLGNRHDLRRLRRTGRHQDVVPTPPLEKHADAGTPHHPQSPAFPACDGRSSGEGGPPPHGECSR